MGWLDVTNHAEKARLRMLRNLDDGEREFSWLLKLHPLDGMIYYQRALAYESLGHYEAARRDFEKAHLYFVRHQWQEAALKGLERVRPLVNS
jgi:tetratricopeptide (TPR) repeat protein